MKRQRRRSVAATQPTPTGVRTLRTYLPQEPATQQNEQSPQFPSGNKKRNEAMQLEEIVVLGQSTSANATATAKRLETPWIDNEIARRCRLVRFNVWWNGMSWRRQARRSACARLCFVPVPAEVFVLHNALEHVGHCLEAPAGERKMYT